MSHHRFADKPEFSLESRDMAVRHAHQHRGTPTAVFQATLDRRHRALAITDRNP